MSIFRAKHWPKQADAPEFELLTPEEARRQAKAVDFSRCTITYVLWDATEAVCGLLARPFYVGTAKHHSRIYNHARKDRGNVKLARKSNAHPLANFVEAKVSRNGPGWLRLTLRRHPSVAAAREDERALIRRWGIRREGGLLFNRRRSG